MNFPSDIDSSWTLFLDRDGVINEKLENDYVRKWEQFKFLPGALEALAKLSKIFKTIVVVTNQQGVGKGLYTEDDLNVIHQNMLSEIALKGGRIDKVYFSPYLVADNSDCRKPKTGMAAQAKAEFPGIDYKRSIMVGDSVTDIEFGKALGMIGIGIGSKEKLQADYHFNSIIEFADFLTA